MNTDDGPIICPASSIVIDSLALRESIPLVGIPFSLNISSDRMKPGFFYQTKTIGLGGWMPTLLHLYDPSKGIIYTGDGRLRNVQGVAISGGYYVASESASEVYYFNSAGRHLMTKDGLSGVVKYNFSYDSQARLVSVVDQFANAVTIQYVTGAATMTSPYGQVTQLTFDTNGYLSTLTNPNGETYTTVQNANGKLNRFTRPGGQQSSFSYDSVTGFLTKDVGPAGNTILLSRTFNPSSQTQVVTATSSLNRVTQYQTYAVKGESTHSVTFPDGTLDRTRAVDQNSSGGVSPMGEATNSYPGPDPRFNWMSPYSSSSSYYIQYSNVNVLSETSRSAVLANNADPFSIVSLTSNTILQNDPARTYASNYVAATGATTITSPMGRVLTQTRNPQGLLTSFQSANLNPVQLAYDARGRLVSSTQGARQTLYSYDANGNLATQTDSQGRVTSYQYDNANRPVSQTLPDGNVIGMTYDSSGNMTSITPPGKAAHTFMYNALEFLQSYLPPTVAAQVTGATTYAYNLDKQMTQMNLPSGAQINYNYNAQSGVLSSINSGPATYSYTYDPTTGQLSTVESPDAETTANQYVGSIKTSETNSGLVTSSVSTTLNSDAALASRTVGGPLGSGQTIQFGYDKDSLLISAGNITYVRDITGAIVSSSIDKINEKINYDNFREHKSDEFKFKGTAIFTQNLTRDHLGRVTSESILEDKERDRSYKYDKQGRLIEVSNQNRVLRTYRYDSNGNRIEKRILNENFHAQYDEQDRLVKYGNTTYTYSANGERLKKTVNLGHQDFRETNYTFDDFGNLKGVMLPGGRHIDYILDASNRRVGKKINGKLVKAYIYQSQTQIAAELNGDGKITKQFVYGEKSNIPDYIIINNKEYRLISDQVGTPRLVIETKTGVALETLSYDEFGIRREADPESILPFGFAGGLYDEDTKLVHFGARDYDPSVGRWTSKDPILFGGHQTNLYGYTFNDPINFVDPSGLWGFGITASASAEAGIVAAGAGVTGSVGAGIFGGGPSGINGGAFGSAGGFAGGPGYGGSCPANNSGGATEVGGAYAGFGAGGFITNATSAAALSGPFNTFSFNTPIGGIQFGSSGGTWILSITGGPGLGASGGSYPTNTWATGH